MDLGIFSMPLHPPEKPLAQGFEEDLAWFAELEEKGFSELWAGEHITSQWENYPAGDLFLAALARETKTMRLGTGVALLPLHNPGAVALRIAFLDQLSGGRVNFGVGPGGLTTDRPFLDVDVDRGVYIDRFRESLEMILTIWTSEAPYDLDGKYWRVNLPAQQQEIGLGWAMPPLQKPHPPIMIPGVSYRSSSIAMAGKRGWRCLSTNFLPNDDLVGQWEAYSEGARSAGRDPDPSLWGITRDVFVADTDAEAERFMLECGPAASYTRYMFDLTKGSHNFVHFKGSNPDRPDSDITPKFLFDNTWIAGSPQTVAEKINSIRDRTAPFGQLVMIAHDIDDFAPWRHSIDLLTNQVVPLIER